jgi:glycosyltransferase involved in cell wall biosynthesis
MRAPNGSGRDLKKIWSKLGGFLRGARTVDDGVKVFTLLQVPLHRFGLARRFNRALMVWTLRWRLWRDGIQSPVAWFMLPHLAPVVGRLGERLSVYYVTDDHASLPDVNVEAIRSMDEELTRKADFVFVASATLLADKLKLNPNSRVSPHGVDFDHFARAQDVELEFPADVAALPRPVIGFFGLIERWIDLDLVHYLAQERPQYSFVLVGRLAVPEEKVPRLANIHYLGKRPYDVLPSYGKSFDVAIIPYRLTQQVLHANPIKLREYLAMGKPVVSVSTPEIDKFADVVEIAHSREEFLQKLDMVLAQPSTPSEVQHRKDRVSALSWNARVQEVLDVVGLSNRPAPAPRELLNAR